MLAAFAAAGLAAAELRPGLSTEVQIGPGETHEYTMPLAADDFVYVLVRQKGVAVTITLTSPDSGKLASTDAAGVRYGPERLLYLAMTAGGYVLRVGSTQAAGAAATYQLQVLRMGPASDRDRAIWKANLLLQEATRLQEGRKWKEAADRFTEALELQRSADDRLGEANALTGLADALTESGKERDALAHYTEAADLFHQLEDSYHEAVNLFNRGVNERQLGDKNGSLVSFNEALRLFESTQSRSEQASCLHQIGQTYWSLGERQNVLQYFTQALNLQRAAGDKAGEANILNSIGAFYYNIDDNDRALEYFRRALDLDRKLGKTKQIPVTLYNIGERFRFLGQTTKAVASFEEALALARAAGDRKTEARILSSLGTCYAASGQMPLAIERLNQALTMAGSLQDTAAEADALSKLGDVLGKAGRGNEGLEDLTRALSLDRERGYAPGQAQTLYRMALIEAKELRLPEARSHVEAALAIVEGVWTRILSPQWRAHYLGSKRDYYDLYVDILMKLHVGQPEAGFDAEAFAAAEKVRARSLLDTLVEAQADLYGDLDPGLLEREASLRRGLAKAVQTQYGTANQTRSQREQSAQEVSRLLEQYETIQGQMRQSSPRYEALVRPEPTSAKEIQGQMESDSVLLEYCLGRRQSYVWVLSRDHLNSFWLPAAEQIEKVARAAYAQLQKDTTDLPAVRQLSRLLLGPVKAELWRKRIVVVPDGVLQYIPFSTLPDPVRPNLPLMSNHEVVHLPSSASLAILRRQSSRKEAVKTLAVFADPVFDHDDPRVAAANRAADPVEFGLTLRRLPFTRQEAAGIARYVAPPQRQEALDFDASRALFLSEEMKRYRILHLATHAVLNTEHPELSGVVLSMVNKTGARQDGFVRMVDLYHLRLGAELVVLSACETALGKEIRGEGLVGLTRGFMYAGAPRVVSSLWKVDDRATAELMRNFYDRMLGPAKLRPAAALRAAQVALSRQPRWQSPYYWGAFVLQGEWR